MDETVVKIHLDNLNFFIKHECSFMNEQNLNLGKTRIQRQNNYGNSIRLYQLFPYTTENMFWNFVCGLYVDKLKGFIINYQLSSPFIV